MSDVWSMLGGIGGALGGIGSIAGDFINADIGNKNLQMQQQVFDYEKSMQRESWNREDNAVQRRVADLKKAGLSPVLAAGQGANSSAPIHVTAPQREPIDLKSPATLMSIISMNNDIARTQAQNMLTEQQARSVKADTDTKLYDLEFYMKHGVPTNYSGGLPAQAVLPVIDRIKHPIKTIKAIDKTVQGTLDKIPTRKNFLGQKVLDLGQVIENIKNK